MERAKSKIRAEYSKVYKDLNTEELGVIHEKDVFESKLIANNKTAREDTGAVNDSASKVEIREATNRGELLIDKKCLLSFPLNDPHTPKEVRENYLLQEELMMSKFLETLMSEWNEE